MPEQAKGMVVLAHGSGSDRNPIPQFKTTAKLGEFLETRFSQSF